MPVVKTIITDFSQDEHIVAEVTGRKPTPNFGKEFRDKIATLITERELSQIRILPTHVLVATYIRDRVSANLLAAAPTKHEDRWQGKVGLVLKLGENAFESGHGIDFGNFSVGVGDFAVYRNSDGWEIGIVPFGKIEPVLCRLIPDEEVMAKVTRPELVY